MRPAHRPSVVTCRASAPRIFQARWTSLTSILLRFSRVTIIVGFPFIVSKRRPREVNSRLAAQEVDQFDTIAEPFDAQDLPYQSSRGAQTLKLNWPSGGNRDSRSDKRGYELLGVALSKTTFPSESLRPLLAQKFDSRVTETDGVLYLLHARSPLLPTGH